MNTSFRNWILTLAAFAPLSFGAHAATPWQEVISGTPPYTMRAVVADNGGFVAAGNICSTKASSDGLNWAMYDEGSSSCFFYDIAWDGERYVAVGNDIGKATYTIYDATFTPAGHAFPIGDGNAWSVVTALPGVGAGFMIIGRDSDGWTKVWWLEWIDGRPTVTLGPSLEIRARINDVIWDGAKFIAVGERGAIMTSVDGSNWLLKPSGTMAELNAIAFNSTLNTYVAVGDNNTILYSQDQAQNWALQTAPNPHQLFGVAWNGEKFVAVGTGNRVLSSSTGSIWFEERVANLPTSTYLHDVAWSPALKRWIAVGENGVVVTNESIFSGHFEPRVPRPSPF